MAFIDAVENVVRRMSAANVCHALPLHGFRIHISVKEASKAKARAVSLYSKSWVM